MSATHTGSILHEFDPLSVYRKARQLVRRYPETAPVVNEAVRNYEKLFDDLGEDFDFLSGGES